MLNCGLLRLYIHVIVMNAHYFFTSKEIGKEEQYQLNLIKIFTQYFYVRLWPQPSF